MSKKLTAAKTAAVSLLTVVALLGSSAVADASPAPVPLDGHGYGDYGDYGRHDGHGRHGHRADSRDYRDYGQSAPYGYGPNQYYGGGMLLFSQVLRVWFIVTVYQGSTPYIGDDGYPYYY